MGSTITLSWFELLGIVAVSIFAGWIDEELPTPFVKEIRTHSQEWKS
ncbi:MAG: hypothetical protein WCA38_03390 [Candidatus Acidiferrales bacterium]